MPLGDRVQALPGNELLRNLPLELDAVGTLCAGGTVRPSALAVLSLIRKRSKLR